MMRFKQLTIRFNLFLLATLFTGACELIELTPTEKEEEIEELPDKNYEESGIASYYADKFEGRTTASGEIFRQDSLTAAHKTLPFGTMVRVTNLANNKSIEVKINDRGPFVKGRIIDLSRKGAETLDYINAGLADVIIEAVLPADIADSLQPVQ
ncbi:septal ring lytic transglycosylase RlpA family protein [Flexithrix dorotheae]|uniref:septal ring lytic transglycosylase RlpA family protein n=1 Tax=Flexithrix dorotheae TaxID=70993 RepID=UPI0003A1EA02|nr:septal ring lytic transglycosylase RlpA family protein [Flexithrix dorotheae]